VTIFSLVSRKYLFNCIKLRLGIRGLCNLQE